MIETTVHFNIDEILPDGSVPAFGLSDYFGHPWVFAIDRDEELIVGEVLPEGKAGVRNLREIVLDRSVKTVTLHEPVVKPEGDDPERGEQAQKHQGG